MKDFFIYIVQCLDGSYYIGHTDNLEARISAHQLGIAECYTQNRRPVKLVFAQPCASRSEAIIAEQQIKGWSRKKKEALITGKGELLNMFSKRGPVQKKINKKRTYGSRLAEPDGLARTSPRTD